MSCMDAAEVTLNGRSIRAHVVGALEIAATSLADAGFGRNGGRLN